jgi:hypothetical protein
MKYQTFFVIPLVAMIEFEANFRSKLLTFASDVIAAAIAIR